MKIFISWSGARSRTIAEALNDWLKRVIQAVKPFYSPEIEKGAKWSNEVDAALEGTKFGIVCLTPDNLESRWIHYEAGALSKTPDAVIFTFLHGIEPGDVPQPLGKFMATEARKDDVLKMLMAINKRLADVGGEPLEVSLLGEYYEMFWPKLEEKLKAAEKLSEQKAMLMDNVATEQPRDEREILLEILEIVRSQQRPQDFPDYSPASPGIRGATKRIKVVKLVPLEGESLSDITPKLIKEAINVVNSHIAFGIGGDLFGGIEILFDTPLTPKMMYQVKHQLERLLGGAIIKEINSVRDFYDGFEIVDYSVELPN